LKFKIDRIMKSTISLKRLQQMWQKSGKRSC
jgi:hypothetical protein